MMNKTRTKSHRISLKK